MENELLVYISGGVAFVSAVTFVVSSYRLNKRLKKVDREKLEEYEQQQKAKANELERTLASIPEEQRQMTIEAINIITKDPELHRFYIKPILGKYSQN